MLACARHRFLDSRSEDKVKRSSPENVFQIRHARRLCRRYSEQRKPRRRAEGEARHHKRQGCVETTFGHGPRTFPASTRVLSPCSGRDALGREGPGIRSGHGPRSSASVQITTVTATRERVGDAVRAKPRPVRP